ncbi:cytochrome c biogenesis heme-transporting ATPase CcmA [Agaribacter marinus]|uniref:Cytochrome c biogenesis ATP-binding export protein CcmA n=1 Tax=Agaribacter marinus TaxID=1431249 RepID=A0AA37SWD5_9ALTE|nr:cytochrome c biogenesis heme-transporting ATPase CcmA [Agaribacter marinus]GLR70903.1 cytochrome c biogenesis ATP-binding export protein CcmA [Agaribacter marinus]
MSILRLINISCEKQDRLLFSNLDINIDAGELFFLKGENGAGKTSLLRILTGLSRPATGQVVFCGNNVSDDTNQLDNLVYCGHKLGLNSALSAVENLVYWAKTHKQTVTIPDIERVLSLLSLVGMEDLALKYLSAGQQRRVALARLWLNEKAILWVLDEPFTALDTQTISLLESKISEFVVNGGSVVLTSHQQAKFSCPQRNYILEYQI